jgi:hypothetical protein
MFFVLKPKFKKCEQVWFLKSHVGKNPLGRTVKTLVEGMLGINTKEHTLTNKTPKRIGITRMEEGMVPVEKCMMITGHRDLKSCAKYKVCILDSEQRACQDLISGNSVLT